MINLILIFLIISNNLLNHILKIFNFEILLFINCNHYYLLLHYILYYYTLFYYYINFKIKINIDFVFSKLKIDYDKSILVPNSYYI